MGKTNEVNQLFRLHNEPHGYLHQDAFSCIKLNQDGFWFLGPVNVLVLFIMANFCVCLKQCKMSTFMLAVLLYFYRVVKGCSYFVVYVDLYSAV